MKLQKQSTVILSILLLVTSAQADGFRNPPDTAAAVGEAGKVVAWVNDASAVFFNPANLADITNRQFLISSTIGYGQTKFRSLTGATTETTRPWFDLPSMAMAWPLQDDLVFGIGLNVPFGRQSCWDKNGFFRDLTPVYTSMMVVDLNPSLAWRISDQVSVGAGLDIYYGRLQFNQYIPWGAMPLGAGEGLARGTADGWAVGANAGITWRLTPDQRIALTCRAPFNLHFTGDMTVLGGTPPPYLASAVASSSSAATTFQFPTIVALAYGLKVTETLKLEADAEWLQYSRFKRMNINAGANTFLSSALSAPTDWNNTWTCGLGASWQFATQWTLRGGYEYLVSPSPNRTFAPSILDNSQSLVAFGLGWRNGPNAVDLGAAIGIFGGRTVRNDQIAAYNGDYDFSATVVSLTYTRDF